MKREKSNKILSKVLYILDKNNSIDYSLSTHADLENISFFPFEKEVLFFPFSSFEIKGLKEEIIDNENIYKLNLQYLEKYTKEFLNDEKEIPNDSIYKKELIESGLIAKEDIEHKKVKDLFNEYIIYKNEIYNMNLITAEINITEDDINKEIRIINSYEESKKENVEQVLGEENEKDIKNKCIIKINGKIINFNYFHIFNKVGIYKIEYIINGFLRNLNNMFYGCLSLNKLNLSQYNTQYVSNMSNMFNGCSSLINLDLSNFNTEYVYDMSYMFNGCSSLINLNLSKFNTEYVNNMSYMFSGCSSL